MESYIERLSLFNGILPDVSVRHVPGFPFRYRNRTEIFVTHRQVVCAVVHLGDLPVDVHEAPGEDPVDVEQCRVTDGVRDGEVRVELAPQVQHRVGIAVSNDFMRTAWGILNGLENIVLF